MPGSGIAQLAGMNRALRRLRTAVTRNLTPKLIVALLVLLIVASWAFFVFESRPGTAEYGSYWEALEDILILAFSGFDTARRPATPAGYAAAFAVLLSGIIFVTLLMGDAAAFLVKRALRTDKGARKIKAKDHILICNWNDHGRAIIDELLADEASRNLDLVIVADVDEHPYPESGVEFVAGSPTRDDVLTRACVEQASTAIVMGNGSDITTSDSLAILTALAVEARHPEAYTCVLVFDPENKKHLQHANVDEIVCISEVTDRILAHSALNHGITALISQLFEFGEGCEIYKVRLPRDFFGLDFMAAARAMLDTHEALLIGMEVADSTNGRRRVVTTPKLITSIEDGDCAFVVAETIPAGLSCAE